MHASFAFFVHQVGCLAMCQMRSLESYLAHTMKYRWLRQECKGHSFVSCIIVLVVCCYFRRKTHVGCRQIPPRLVVSFESLVLMTQFLIVPIYSLSLFATMMFRNLIRDGMKIYSWPGSSRMTSWKVCTN